MIENPKPKEKGRISVYIQLLIWALLLSLLALVAIGLYKEKSPILEIGMQVPDFTLTLYTGYEYADQLSVKLSDLLGKVVVINFWASWCQPCESEAADLEAAWQIYRPDGEVIFLGVNYVDTEPEARSYLENFKNSYPNGPDLGTDISRLFNRNLGVPETYIINKQGVLKYRKIGPFLSVAEIQMVIAMVLAE